MKPKVQQIRALRRWPWVLVASALAITVPGGAAHAGTVEENTWWLGYMSSWWFNPKRAIWFDSHYNDDSFAVFRGGLSFVLRGPATVTGGYAYALTNPDLERREHRPWAQVVVPVRLSGRWRFTQRVRTDLRFQQSLDDGEIGSGWDRTFRARYQFTFTHLWPAGRFGQPLVQLGDEILVNVASTASKGGLDQNRASVMAGVKLTGLTIRFGYMQRFIPGNSGSPDRIEHTALLWFTQSLDIGGGRRRQLPEAGTP